MEYMSHGTLYLYLRSQQGMQMSTAEMISLAKGIAAGFLQSLHDKNAYSV
jgi:hypothetical protein